ncbi:MAG: phosphoglycerate kinase [Dehalococcoidia bacterium]|nr:phosphoglycerate kinase [Dehalococcoidia bacterium]
MEERSVREIDVRGKRVLLRVDFNVPLDVGTGSISDDHRIRASLPTIQYLVDCGAKVIICSHLGRPKGKVVEGLSLKPVAERLSRIMGLPVRMAGDCVGDEVKREARELEGGKILLLENVRFHPEEEANDPGFACSLAGLADVYVDDAFGTAHRAHASTVGVSRYLPSAAGFLMEKELDAMGNLLHDYEHPFACLIGGAKVSDKIGLLQNMLKKIDILLVGGGMAATFLRAEGYETGFSLVEKDKLNKARELLDDAHALHVSFRLPCDVLVSREIRKGSPCEVVPIESIPDDGCIVDIGPKTVELFCRKLTGCRTVMWNGPMGIYEIPEFSQGTKLMVDFISKLDAVTVVGGGSSAEIVHQMGLSEKMTHVSTGGGATLRFLEGTVLPGVEVLRKET